MHVEGIARQSSVLLKDTVDSMTKKLQFPGFMFMFPQVVQKHTQTEKRGNVLQQLLYIPQSRYFRTVTNVW